LGWGWDGALRRPKSCFVKEGFKLVAKTGYGRTVSNVQGKGIPNDASSYRETVRPKTCADTEDAPPPQSAMLGLHSVDRKLLLISHPAKGGRLS